VGTSRPNKRQLPSKSVVNDQELAVFLIEKLNLASRKKLKEGKR